MANNAFTLVAENSTLSIKGDVTFLTVPKILRKTRKIFATQIINAIDLANIQHSDSAGVALLIELLRLKNEKNKALAFINMPAKMRNLVKICDLTSIFESVKNE